MKSLQKHRFKVKLFAVAMALANRLAAIPNKLSPPLFRLLQIESAFWQSRVLYVACKLGIADALGDGVLTTAELARTLSLHEENLYRLLRMLASVGIFVEIEHRRFRNNNLSEPLRSDSAKSVRDMILMHNSEVMVRPWLESLESGIREGETPFVRSHGTALFGYMDSHPEFDALFARAMDEVESLTGQEYLQDFDWSGFTRLIDVGGSKGTKTLTILQQNPQLQAVVFDRPQVIAAGASYWRSQGAESLLNRVEFVGGDMFASVPPARSGSDLYLCIALFHGIGDEDAGRLLKNIRQAMCVHRATLLVVDSVAEEVGIDPNVAAMDMQMLINTLGRERTRSEWEGLFQRNGFALREVIAVRSFARFIVVDPL